MASREVELIKERLGILEVVGGYVELHKAGRHYKGKSPFTSEKTPSFFVSPDRGMYYCFSSQKGGDIFTFVEEMEGVDFKGALKLLAEKAGVELVPEDPKKRDARETQYALIEAATQFFFKTREEHKEVTRYVEGRGVTGETIHTWRIGYAPDEWRALRSHLREKKFTDEQMLAAGLIKKADGGKEPYDVFRDRVMFPICDPTGRVVAFSGRTLKKDDNVPKYVNSPETELFQKSEILYGYDKAKQGIRQYDFSLIVEGQFDVVLSHQAGYSNAVAVSGTALTPHHLMLLERLSHRAVLALDADRAGISAVKRSAILMLERGMDIKVAHMPDGNDPADIIKIEPSTFKHIIGKAAHVIEYLLSILKETSKDVRTYKLRAREEILPLVAAIPDRIDRDHFEQIVADAVETTKEAIHYELERLSAAEARQGSSNSSDTVHAVSSVTTSRRENLKLYLQGMIEVLKKEHQELGEKLKSEYEQLTEADTDKNTLETDTSKLSGVIFKLEEQIEGMRTEHLVAEISEQLTEFSHILAREQLAGLRKKMMEAESKGVETDLKKYGEATKRAQVVLQQTRQLEL